MTTAFPRLIQPEKKECCFWFDEGAELNSISYPCIVKDDKGYKMYYLPWPSSDVKKPKAYLAVIESQDGIHWSKPDLNILDHPELKKNNVVIDDLEDGMHVMFDPNPACDPQEKYKAVGMLKNTPGISAGLWCYTSPDGYHFTRSHCLTVCGAFDSLNVAYWSEGRYVCYLRNYHQNQDGVIRDLFTDLNEGPRIGAAGAIRDIRVMYSDDFRVWTEPELICFDDGKDYPLYTNNVMRYPRAPHVLIGFPVRYCERQEWTRNNDQMGSSSVKKEAMTQIQKREGLAVTDCIFMCSHDGKTWHRYNEAFLTPGYETEHNWVYGDCYGAYDLIDSGREVYYMYTNDWHRSKGHPKPLNRYEIRKDGFACYMADGEERVLVTKPLVYEGNDLHINFTTSAYGYIYVDVLDEEGNPLSDKKSFEIYGDNIDRKICFSDDTDFSGYVGQTVRLRFRMLDAKIYSMCFM